MTFEELFNEIEKTSESPIIASIFLDDLKRAIARSNRPGWQYAEVNPSHLQGLKDLVEFEFMITCAMLKSIDDDPIYAEATEIADVFCKIVNERFNARFVSPRIVSLSELAAQKGIVEIFTGEDGQKCVRLTPEGEVMAKDLDERR